jgi:GNAT superfamily N-acetyltransferase
MTGTTGPAPGADGVAVLRELSPSDDAALTAAWPVMAQLRPNLVDAGEFVRRVREQMAEEGYRLVAADDAEGVPRALAGFRIQTMLWRGRSLYVDDLVTDAAVRSGGYGRALFEWLVAEGRRLGCAQLHLDSGVQRFDAHRFYLRQRMAIVGHHFSLALDDNPAS